MMKDRRLKHKFKQEFGVNVDDWFDDAKHQSAAAGQEASAVDDELDNEKDAATEPTSEQLKTELGEQPDESKEGGKDTQYYLSEEEFNDQRLLNRLTESNEALSRLIDE